MKKLTLLCSFFLLLIMPVLAQSEAVNTVVPDQRLSEVYSEDQLQNFQETQPQLLAYYNYFLDHSFYVDDIPESKAIYLTDLSTLVRTNKFTGAPFDVSFEEDNLNVLLFKISLKRDQRVSYRLGETNKVITFYSKDEFLANFNASSGTVE